jgi:hypothetical protein
MEKVAMVHPDLPDTKENPRIETKEGFEKAWKASGWKLAPKTAQPETEEK